MTRSLTRGSEASDQVPVVTIMRIHVHACSHGPTKDEEYYQYASLCVYKHVG